ncbi:GNAT family N-acetyltransferase [Bacillus sp. es.036]|uniref:GNAT family N-acetyltransferase n=1 Tax=Bacillus sp. es.036 TaxID=1761764 RepID=UPI000C00FB54|nr:GNAT family N-acetyltransferase [Bacillus sp. es.036]PFG13414.1 RimJ/RimL family protein N-acetyltransferase [Bacillus sp. es.036]
MHPIIKNGDVSIRYLKDGDGKYLLKWLTDPAVLTYYEGKDRPYTYEKVLEDFFLDDDETRCLVLFKNTPIGYIQFYLMIEVDGITLPTSTYGMDQFIGETSYWNQGIGKILVQSVVYYIETTLKGSMIVMDPQKWNERAIRCYEHVGFTKVGVLPNHEYHEGKWNDCFLMVNEFATYRIQPLSCMHQKQVTKFFTESWGSSEMVISTGTYKLHELEGFVACSSTGKIIGAVTFKRHDRVIEIISLDSVLENQGIGSRLIMMVELIAVEYQYPLIRVITTNDNMRALNFYQRKGYRIKEVIQGAVDRARQAKPEIPLIGEHDIPIHDELVLYKKLSSY